MQEFSVIVRARDSRHFKNVYSIPDSVEFLLTDKSDKSWEPSAKRGQNVLYELRFLTRKNQGLKVLFWNMCEIYISIFFIAWLFLCPHAAKGVWWSHVATQNVLLNDIISVEVNVRLRKGVSCVHETSTAETPTFVRLPLISKTTDTEIESNSYQSNHAPRLLSSKRYALGREIWQILSSSAVWCSVLAICFILDFAYEVLDLYIYHRKVLSYRLLPR